MGTKDTLIHFLNLSPILRMRIDIKKKASVAADAPKTEAISIVPAKEIHILKNSTDINKEANRKITGYYASFLWGQRQ